MQSDPKRMSAGYPKEQFFLRSAEEMKANFAEVPEAVLNTVEIAEKCNLEIQFGKLHYPVFHPPEHFTREGYLRHLLAEVLRKRYGIHARAEGEEFVVERVDDPKRLPAYVAQASAPASSGSIPAPGSHDGKDHEAGMLREPAGKDACATEAVAAAVKAVIDR